MINKIYEKNLRIFTSNSLSTNDVLLIPRQGLLKSRKDAETNSVFLFSSPMDTVTDCNFSQTLLKENQAPVFCRFSSKEQKEYALKTFASNTNFWFSVGFSLKDYDFLNTFCLANKIKVNVAVDVAHGDTKNMSKVYSYYSKASWCKSLMSGTIATAQSAFNVARAGCTHIRIGIGPGSACSTRIVTGCGVPNLTAVFNVWSAFQDYPAEVKPVLIADGGIKNYGDIVKYLSVGADAVMIGNLFSKCIESAGWQTNIYKRILNIFTFNIFFKDYLYKKYRGQASKDFQIEHKGVVSGTPEGVSGNIQHPTNTIKNLVYESRSAIASALSYLGLKNINDLNPNNVEFLKISSASLQESKPHLLE